MTLSGVMAFALPYYLGCVSF